MKVYIATDMEGISGIVDRAQISPPGVDLRRGRTLLTEDTNAAIRGALAAGVGEIGLYGLAAGHRGVPVVLVSGDDRLVAETREWFPWAVPVVVKYAIGRHAARLMHPVRAQQLIEQKTIEALRGGSPHRPLPGAHTRG